MKTLSELPKKLPVGIWIRVSTDDQAQGDSPQHHEIRARSYAETKGWEVRELYDLAGVSGKSVKDHPEAKRMLEDVRSGKINALIFSKFARLARNTKELLDFADEFEKHEADLVSLQESIDTSTPAGRLFWFFRKNRGGGVTAAPFGDMLLAPEVCHGVRGDHGVVRWLGRV